jgi:hypothetical protein
MEVDNIQRKNFAGNSQEIRPRGRFRRKWEDNTKIELKEIV